MVKRLALSDAPPPGNPQWDTARCKRAIRPLSIKLKALREEVKRSETRTQKPRRTLSPDSGDNYEENKSGARKKSRKPLRTYGAPKMVYGKNAAQVSSTSSALVTVVSKGTKNIDYASLSCRDRTDGPLPLHWSASADRIAKGMVPASQDLSKIVKPIAFTEEANTRIHRHQEAVYLALDQFLFATSPPAKGPAVPTLASLASRQVAYCILAVGDDGMDWYDYVKGYGRSGEYLREVVRWHGIELLKDALADGAMDPVDGGAGAIGTCIGLCRKHGAEREAEALLETLLFFNPVFNTSKTNPAFETIRTYFSMGPGGFVPPSSVYRILKAFTPLVYENPSWMSSKEIQAILIMAMKDIEVVPTADEIVIKLLESAFGLPSNYKTGEESPHEGINLRSMPKTGRQKGEEAIAGVIRTLVRSTFHWAAKSNSRGALIHLVKGYLSQDQASKVLAQDMWREEWPGLVTSKIMAMAHVQQWSCSEASCTDYCLETGCFKESLRECRDEVALCLELVTSALHGDDGFLLVAEYVRECYLPDTPSVTKEEHAKELARINSLTGRLLASISEASSSDHASIKAPKTPKPSAPKVIIFTPGKLLTPQNQKWEKRRFLIGQLVLKIATQYQESAVSFKHEWVKWATNIEKKVLALKIKTPLETTVLREDLRTQSTSPKEKLRKGWRYEEGLGEWVSTGQTPGRKNRTPRKTSFEVVVYNRKKGVWRQEYPKLPRHSVRLEISDSEDGSGSACPGTEDGELDSESEEDQGSLYQGSDSEKPKIKLPPPRSVHRTQAIKDSLRRFPMRSQIFLASTPIIGRSAEFSSPIARENLLSRFIDSGEIPTSDPAKESDESEDEDNEEGGYNKGDGAVDEDGAEVDGRARIPDSSPIVSRLTRHNQSPFITGPQEPITALPVTSPVQSSAYAPSPVPSSPSSPPHRTKPTYDGDDDDMDIDSDLGIGSGSGSNYEPTVTPSVPSSSRKTSNSLEDELSVSDAAFSCHRRRLSSPTPALKAIANAPASTPRAASSSNLPLSASSKRKIERSARRRSMGRKRATARKRAIAEIARQEEGGGGGGGGEDQMSADELA